MKRVLKSIRLMWIMFFPPKAGSWYYGSTKHLAKLPEGRSQDKLISLAITKVNDEEGTLSISFRYNSLNGAISGKRDMKKKKFARLYADGKIKKT